jgi:hypothetical protein
MTTKFHTIESGRFQDIPTGITLTPNTYYKTRGGTIVYIENKRDTNSSFEWSGYHMKPNRSGKLVKRTWNTWATNGLNKTFECSADLVEVAQGV